MGLWNDLAQAQSKSAARRISSLFDKTRAQDFSTRVGDMLFDYSKTNIDTDTMALLVSLAQTADVTGRRDAMFAGQKINQTEGRAVLHTALRNLDGDPVMVDGIDVMPEVLATLERMEHFANDLRAGRFTGQGGEIRDVVNIGIGGSDLGPAMATLAMVPYHDGPALHFVSNIDGAHIHDTLRGLNPATTLIIVASKSFSTVETMTNAKAAYEWLAASCDDPAAQFVALSTALEATSGFGIPPERVFGFEDWVGGRYSIWGPIGLSLMLAIGPDNFREFLRGGAAMDAHFRSTDAAQNMPVMLALVGIWHHQICGYPTRAVLPYDQRLARLPAYFQQLEMESNGKSVAMDGNALTRASGPVVWGEPGTGGQHAFYQLIHQGTDVVPCDFLVAATGHEPDLTHQHQMLLANCLAQSKALMLGRTLDVAREMMVAKGMTGDECERQARHRVFAGNRPSTTLIYPKLTPYVLGQIIALYEHRVFVEGVILGINSYDQWGVELGKELATALTPVVAGESAAKDMDGSTQMLVDYIHDIN